MARVFKTSHDQLFSTVAVQMAGSHAWLDVWNRGAHCGKLTVLEKDWIEVTCLLLNLELSEIEKYEVKP